MQDIYNPSQLQKAMDIPQVGKHMFTAKINFKHQRFDDLDIFRQQIEQSKAGLHHQPYTNNKRNVVIYKTIFFAFSFVFFALSLISLGLPAVISFGLFLPGITFMKGLVIGICTILSLSALAIGLTIQAEREAVLKCVRKAKDQLATIYGRKRHRFGLISMGALFGKQRQQSAALKQMYQEGLDKINDKKDEALHLVHRISTAETLDPVEKQALLNQAIEELSEKLQLLTHSFRHAALPHFAA